MSTAVHETMCIDPTEGCAVDYLTSQGVTGAAYYCGKCSLIAARGTDGAIYTDEGECELLLIDAADHDLQVENV